MVNRIKKHSLYLLIIGLIAANTELDIFLPYLPKMQAFFGVSGGQIEGVLIWNFWGICVSGLFAGWLSDALGRKKVILGGMTLVVVGSFGCVFAQSFSFL